MRDTSAMQNVTMEFAQGVAHVQLSRPAKINALDVHTILELVNVGDQLRARADCRAVVLSGSGRGFCSGLDLDALKSASRGESPAIDIDTVTHGDANIAQQAVLQWRLLPMPVIAAVHGVAFGGGLQLALGADIRIVHPEARLALIEVKWGLIPDMAGMMLLPKLLRPDIAAELVFTARTFSGQEALQLGLATRVADDPLAVARTLAAEIAARSPDAIRAAKRLLSLNAPGELLRAEAREQQALFGKPNQRAAVAAAMARQTPVFQD
jgi:enoyl-CoA hydratase/carnithine racemase